MLHREARIIQPICNDCSVASKESSRIGPEEQLLGQEQHGQRRRLQMEISESNLQPRFFYQHSHELVPYIVNASLAFCDVMREKADTEEIFELEEYAARLTIDIIGKVALDAFYCYHFL